MAAPKAPKLYHYHRDTGEFMGETVARLDPKEQKPLIPANSTIKKPPAAAENQIAVFSSGAWSLVANHRGETWFDFRTKIEIVDLGVTPDPSWTTDPVPLTLAEMTAEAHNTINTDAEITRCNFITFGEGMSIVYQLKREEALKYTSGSNSADFPLMNERATRLGVSMDIVQAEWLAKANEWIAAAADIEKVRETANAAVDAVTDGPNVQKEINAIVTGAIWPTP